MGIHNWSNKINGCSNASWFLFVIVWKWKIFSEERSSRNYAEMCFVVQRHEISFEIYEYILNYCFTWKIYYLSSYMYFLKKKFWNHFQNKQIFTSVTWCDNSLFIFLSISYLYCICRRLNKLCSTVKKIYSTIFLYLISASRLLISRCLFHKLLSFVKELLYCTAL